MSRAELDEHHTRLWQTGEAIARVLFRNRNVDNAFESVAEWDALSRVLKEGMGAENYD